MHRTSSPARTGPRRTALAGAAFTAAAVVLLPLGMPAASAAPDPAPKADATAAATSPYGGYSTGSLVHAEALGLPSTTVANITLGQSAAGAAQDKPLVTEDLLGSSILFANPGNKNAYGHGSGANVGLLADESAVPQIALTTAEALSPPPMTATPSPLLELPLAPLARATILPSTARALSGDLKNVCPPTGNLISSGRSEIANAEVLSVLPGTGLVTAGGTSDSESLTGLVEPVSGASGAGLTSRTTQTLAPLALFEGIPGAGIEIDVLEDVVLSATAGGVAGSAEVFYGFAGIARNDNTTPVLAITVGGQRTTLTSQQLLGNGGLQLSLGVADIFIGAPAHGLNDNPTSAPSVAGNGRAAAAAADFIRIKVPGSVPTGSTIPVGGGPLASLLNPLLTPVINALSPVLTALQSALDAVGLNVADIRYGHLEASVLVPAGGIDCGGNGNPFGESRKDVSSLGVAPGSTFEYTVRFPNRGSKPITDVVVTDTFSGGLEFVSSVPGPDARQGNTLRYDVGTLQPNQFAQIQLTFRVPDDAKVGTVYRNDATIAGTFQGERISTDVTVTGPTVIDTPNGGCDVSRSTKFASNTQVRTGESFAYFINVANSGGQTCNGIRVTDQVPAGTTLQSCTDSCQVSGRTITWDLPSLTPGSAQTLSFTVRVTATSGRLPNVAVIDPDNGPTDKPRTGGPAVTDDSVPSPGRPAGCPATGCPDQDPGTVEDDLAATGANALLPALGLGLLGLGALGLRRRRRMI